MVKRFDEFLIQERLGVSKESLLFLDIIVDTLWRDYNTFYNNYKRDIMIRKRSFSWTKLKPYVSSSVYKKIWKKYPVKEISLNFKFEKNDVLSDGALNFTTGGLMHLFDVKGDSISLKMDIDISTTKSFDLDRDSEALLTEIKSTVSHELNHGLEYYMRMGLNSDLDKVIDPYLGSVEFTNPSKEISDKLFHKWCELGDILYYSQPHEVSAMTQEAWEYVKNLEIAFSDTVGYEEAIKEVPAWRNSQKLIDFNVEKFYVELLELAEGQEYKLDILKEDFMENWMDDMAKYQYLQSTKYNIEFLIDTDLYGFMKYFSTRIREQGKRLRKNLLRLNMLRHKDEDVFFYTNKQK